MALEDAGSGGGEANSSLKKSFQPNDFSRQDALDAAIEALIDAADEDRATGVFDLKGKIYPTCKLMTKGGVENVSDEDILAARERVLAKREEV